MTEEPAGGRRGLSARVSSTRGGGRGLRWLLGQRVTRVGIAGATSGAVDFAVFNLVLLGQRDPSTPAVLAANTFAFACAMVVNYSLNARFSFGVRPTRRSVATYVLFTLVGLGFYNLNLLWIRRVLDADGALMLNVSKVAAMALLVVWNYVGYQRLVFREQLQAARR